jgi:hypothetical protein
MERGSAKRSLTLTFGKNAVGKKATRVTEKIAYRDLGAGLGLFAVARSPLTLYM